MSLHPNLAPVAGLVGTWRGPGRGEYPTTEPFEYTEELVFTDVGKPFLHYAQRTWSPDGAPMHVETGYLRVPGDGTAEFVLALPTGQTELAEGPLTPEPDGFSAELRSRVLNAATARPVDRTVRRLRLRGDELRTELDMAAVGVPLTRHLTSVLARQPVRAAAPSGARRC
ncbi:FABP family protein [uncultured Georgenia sp.]|uniref:FABP family protein n=1 Tax=uncultured Georgenia sp. TaxID=378209 RepID=UPI00261BFB85|nr:FABP family protein [uncultured Georgenia sp.]HLV04247.1 FABP family protein [Actinomycetaceae bacterium]